MDKRHLCAHPHGVADHYSVAVGGAVEESGKSERPIAAVVPLMLFLMATILMLQLQSFQKLFLVVSVAPLGGRGDRPSHAADPAHRGRRQPRHDPDRRRNVLEADGYAMIGGIIVATLLTLFFLPALYVAWYRIKEPEATELNAPPSR